MASYFTDLFSVDNCSERYAIVFSIDAEVPDQKEWEENFKRV